MTEQNKNQDARSIDELISEALKSDEKEFVEHYKTDPSLLEFVSANLRGKMGWLSWLSFILIDIEIGLGIYCGYRAFQTSDPRETMLWASGVVLCFIAIGMLKMWYWIEASRRSTLREIKRLELQVARVAEDAR